MGCGEPMKRSTVLEGLGIAFLTYLAAFLLYGLAAITFNLTGWAPPC